MKKIFLIIVVVTMFIACSEQECPVCPEEPVNPECKYGTIYVAGNEPFTWLAFETNFGVFEISTEDDDLYRQLWSMQGESINNCYYDITLLERGY